VKIRPATAFDIPQMIAIERASSTAAHWGEGQYAALFDRAAIPRIVLVAEIADQNIVSRSSVASILGFIVVRTLADEWELENVMVESSLRRSGIGTRLLQEALELGRRGDCRTMFLEVRESNDSARKFYAKHGFAEAGRRSSYYGNPTEDAVLLHYEFAQELSKTLEQPPPRC
jgi:[ribosomal protein S18]-alanine N-acetyltransferase